MSKRPAGRKLHHKPESTPHELDRAEQLNQVFVMQLRSDTDLLPDLI